MSEHENEKGIVSGENESPWLTVKEAAKRLKIKDGTLRNYMYRGLIPFYKQPNTGTVRLKIDEVDAWMAGRHVQKLK